MSLTVLKVPTTTRPSGESLLLRRNELDDDLTSHPFLSFSRYIAFGGVSDQIVVQKAFDVYTKVSVSLSLHLRNLL